MTPLVQLDAVAEINPKVTATLRPDAQAAFVPMSAVESSELAVRPTERRRIGDVLKGYSSFLDGDLLVAKITPCFENGKIAQASLGDLPGFGSTEFHVVRPRPAAIDGRYLLHFLRRPAVRRAGERRMTGSAGQRRVPEHFIRGLEVPLPPLAEQRRIADILDKADGLRAKRRVGIALLESLRATTFHEIFGGNPGAMWPSFEFGTLLAEDLRNGVSPSKRGRVPGLVLTLSAITGGRFDCEARKTAMFEKPTSKHQTVSADDFLICRGNGNLTLVGVGRFPTESMPDTAFPDTMIAAQIDRRRLVPAYIEAIWNFKSTRQQIEAIARTTNGTFKVNQEALARVRVPVPPIPVQERFAACALGIARQRAVAMASIAGVNALFASLQHRAFRGEL